MFTKRFLVLVGVLLLFELVTLFITLKPGDLTPMSEKGSPVPHDDEEVTAWVLKQLEWEEKFKKITEQLAPQPQPEPPEQIKQLQNYINSLDPLSLDRIKS